MRRAACLSLALLVGLALVPGCVDEGPRDGDGGEEGETYEECDTVTVPFEENGTQWKAAQVTCEANVTGTNSQLLRCREPDRAHLAARANLTAGAVEIRVDDAEGETVAEHRLEGTVGPRELAVDSGAPGEWTLTGERLEGFEGEFRAELACPQ